MSKLTLDLHHQTADAALRNFVTAYNQHVQHSRACIDVVHGYGSSGTGGVIKRRLRALLAAHASQLSFVRGEDLDHNPGHTQVNPRHALPTAADTLAAAILDYCSTARTLDKIAGRFRRHGMPAVQAAVRALTTSGRLQSAQRGTHKLFSSQ